MPTYSYRCTECGHAFDIHQAFTDDSLTACPSCGGNLRKLFSAVGITFNGSGFYRNDSRAAAKSSSSPSSSSSTSSESKPSTPAPAPAATSTAAPPPAGRGAREAASRSPTYRHGRSRRVASRRSSTSGTASNAAACRRACRSSFSPPACRFGSGAGFGSLPGRRLRLRAASPRPGLRMLGAPGSLRTPRRIQAYRGPPTTGISWVAGPAASPARRAIRSATPSGSLNSSNACTRA